MESVKENNEINKYHEDIKTIKGVLYKIDEKPLFDPWFFIVNSLLAFLTAMSQYIATTYFQFTLNDIMFKVYAPIIMISIILEPFAVAKKLSKESLPLFSRPVVKLYIGLIGLWIASVIISILIIKSGVVTILPPVLFCLCGVFYLLYAQVAYNSMFYYGFFMIIAGFLFSFSSMATGTQMMILAIVLGMSLMIIGISEIGKK